MTDKRSNPEASAKRSDPAAKNRLWRPGESGNPAGRAQGSRHKVSLALDDLAEGEAEAILRKVTEAAKGIGAMTAVELQAAKMVLDRIPGRRDRPVNFQLGSISCAEEASAASASILSAVGRGELTPAEGGEVGKLIDTFIKTLESVDFSRRLKALEGRSTTLVTP